MTLFYYSKGMTCNACQSKIFSEGSTMAYYRPSAALNYGL
jgi:hypothetical protein